MSAHLVFDLEKLRERADEVNPLSAAKTISDLKQKLKKYKDLIALCGPQIGKPERVIAIKFNNDVIKVFVNPRILNSEGLHLVRERDVSIPEKDFICPRPNKIRIQYQDEYAKPEENILEGVVAEVFDRMQNYLDGITLEDFGLEVLEGFDQASKKDKEKIIDMYLKSLSKREELVNKAIEEDPEAKQLKEAIRFMEAVDKGEVTFGDEELAKKFKKDKDE